MKQYEFSSRNVQDAIQKGLKELNLKQEDVDIKILSEGGLFSKAKIVIITDEEEVVELKQAEVAVKAEEPKAKKAETKKEVVKKQEPAEKVVEVKQEETVKPKKEVVKKEVEGEKASVTFIKELSEKLGAVVEVGVKEEDENLMVEVNGEHAGALIGYRGEGLAAIQYLANVIEQQNEKEARKRIILNVENYKEKREESLKRLAERMAQKAIRTGRSQRLEPMNAYDRRIIHAALSESAVTTYSKGEEPRRYLVIEPKR